MTAPRRSATHAAWARHGSIQWLREAIQSLALFPLFRIGYKVDVRGFENLERLTRPCFVVSNHNMHLDWGMLLMAFRGKFRRRTAVAASKDDLFSSWGRSFTVRLFGNAFPFENEGRNIRSSLDQTTALLEEGWNILIFPEGGLTVGGPTQPFKSGVGWLAARSGAQVLPARIDILRPGLFEGRWRLFPRGHVRVSFGPPVDCPDGADHNEITANVEQAVLTA